MKIILHRNFKKQYQKLNDSQQEKFRQRRDLFLKTPFHPLLKNHTLHGDYRGCRSINVTADLRFIYEELDSDTAHFIAIGTHAELYE
jgi:addiction module RelE/StbE family toxin